MKIVGVAVLSVEVVVESGENDRTRCGAGSGGGEGVGKKRAFPGEGIEVGSLDDGVSVATGDRRLVIGDEENDVRLFGGECEAGENEEEEKSFHDGE